MVKYFMKGTNKEVHFGDTVEVDKVINGKGGKRKHTHLECVLDSDTLQFLLDNDYLDCSYTEDEPVDKNSSEGSENGVSPKEPSSAKENKEEKDEEEEDDIDKEEATLLTAMLDVIEIMPEQVKQVKHNAKAILTLFSQVGTLQKKIESLEDEIAVLKRRKTVAAPRESSRNYSAFDVIKAPFGSSLFF